VLRDEAIVAWLSSRGADAKEGGGAASAARDGQDCPSYDRAVDEAFGELGVELVALV
jgi:hypothetical protein